VDEASDPVRRLRPQDRIKRLLLPPASLFWLLFLGLAVALRTPYAVFGWSAAGTAVALLYALSTPHVRKLLMRTLDLYPALHPERFEPHGVGALVVLDSGRKSGAREYDGATVREATLERLVYGAWLHRRLGLPVLVSGNGAREMMAEVLREPLGVEARWIEHHSHDTHENAVFSSRLLAGEGIRRVVLVTHFWHMPRAVAAFTAAGLEVVPAPMGLGGLLGAHRFLGALPHPQGMAESYLVVHEWVGIVWYRLRRYRYRPRHGHRR
jgi:uncharacterized SAM-binding protein YcdF (DUF218 family)